MKLDADALLALLPAFYRERDAESGGALRALLAIIAEQGALLEADLQRLYDNAFIETCDDWVVPYIGDLLGVRALHPVSGTAAFGPRALVANTLRLRRRKGTALVLEALAHDATGWRARAVEFFEQLATTQYLDHPRPHAVRTPDLRRSLAVDRIDGPFGREMHTVDVRALPAGRFNLPNVGLYLWRLQAYPVQRGTARPATARPGFYTFDPLGHTRPLFNRPRSETDIGHLAEPINVPEALHWQDLHAELEARRQALTDGDSTNETWFATAGGSAVLRVWVDGLEIAPEHLVVCNLSAIPGVIPEDWRRPPASLTVSPTRPGRPDRVFPAAGGVLVGIDPQRGRLALPSGVTPTTVEVGYACGFPGDIGAGPFDRRPAIDETDPLAALPDPADFDVHLHIPSAATPTLASALTPPANPADAANRVVAGRRTLITLDTDHSEVLSPVLDLPDTYVAIEAAHGRRPVLEGDLHLKGNASTRLSLDGLLINGGLQLQGPLRGVSLRHCTLVPAHGGIDHTGTATDLTLSLYRCLCGAINSNKPLAAVLMRDSVIDGNGGAAIDVDDSALKVNACTVLGSVSAGRIEAANSIFDGLVRIARRQDGCVRYCYLPPKSETPRRYRCQPDLVSTDLPAAEAKREARRVTPAYTSVRFGTSAYTQLTTSTAIEIRCGAEDGAEMGVWQHLQQAQREANLRLALDEYLRFGLDAAPIFVT
ncbi:hypothetical protein J5J83_05020 [Azoarcus sp. L1K30]|uniref:hypothetical protein n=1 Tax=Azoarcus sp. L1K30 TaxID=2820277 RepID=UPI001B834088|nr:hypothetical protein [Azoarcus sp. L1K30]MBR0565480.1 hypothetical protein [Azoarcus sp. L1K30]